MSTGMFLWYMLIVIVCGTMGILILIAIVKFAREKRQEFEAPEPRERLDSALLPLLRDGLNDIVLANMGDQERSADLMILSAFISKLENGERIPKDSVLDVLSKLKGTGALVEAIRGMEE